jgi:hypothetical protein
MPVTRLSQKLRGILRKRLHMLCQEIAGKQKKWEKFPQKSGVSGTNLLGF